MKAKNYFFVIVVLFAMVAASCSKDDVTPGGVTANFTYSIIGKTVTFVSTSSGAISFDWNFGDGDTGYLSSEVHTYSASGTYTVTLEVTGLLGATSTKSQNVVVP